MLETIVLVLGISSVVTYETTGKGLADHAISTIANQDCKIARGFKGDNVCAPEGRVTVTGISSVDEMERVFAQRKGR